MCLSSFMCYKHPLSRYYGWGLTGTVKNICKKNNFVLWYPFSGSSLVSLLLPKSSWNFGCLGRRILKWYLGMRFSPRGLVSLLGLSLATLRMNWFRISDICVPEKAECSYRALDFVLRTLKDFEYSNLSFRFLLAQ